MTESNSSDDSFLRAVAAAPPVASATLGPGVRIGCFVIEEEVGRGGMGTVYIARDEAVQRRVALKVLHEAPRNESERRRFLREARAAARIDHPGIVGVHEVGEDEGRAYLVMEYVAGRSLRTIMADGPLAPLEVLKYARGLGEVVAAAHRSGVVHRDLKPENVLVRDDGAMCVVDFGLAKPTPSSEHGASSTSTEAGQVLGTAGYMAPEQATGLRSDARADVFALGVIVYEMLSGRRPFTGRTRMEVVVATTRDEPPPLSPARDATTRRLHAVVRRCLAKNPDERFIDASALIGELALPPSRIRKANAALVALATLALVAGIGWVARAPTPPARNAASAPSSTAESVAAAATATATAFAPAPELGSAESTEFATARGTTSAITRTEPRRETSRAVRTRQDLPARDVLHVDAGVSLAAGPLDDQK